MENFRLIKLIFIFTFYSLLSAQPSFYLSTNKIFSSIEEAIIQIETVNLEGNVSFRAFQIEDPETYIINQKNINSPDIFINKKTGLFEILNKSINKLMADARSASRRFITYETRANLRDFMNVKSVNQNKMSNLNTSYLNGLNVVKEWESTIKKKYDYWNYHSIRVPVTKQGVYLIEAKIKNLVAYTLCIISDDILITKRVKDRLVVYGINRISGNVINGVSLKLYCDGKEIEKKSLKDGIAEFTISNTEKEIESDPEWGTITDEFNQQQYLLTGKNGKNFLLFDPNMYFYDYDYNNSRDYNSRITYFYTDKSIYRPGQEVSFKAITLNKDRNGGLDNFRKKWIYYTVKDPRDKQILKDSSLTSDYGTIYGKIKISDNSPLGYYSVIVSDGKNEQYFDFEVQEYKKPEFKTEINFDRKRFNNGETITGVVSGNYFFGAPVKNAEVEIYVYKSKYYVPWWSNEKDSWFYVQNDAEYESYYEDLVTTLSGKLDSEGKYIFSVNTELNMDNDFIYKIKANIIDNKKISNWGTKSILLTRGDLYISTYLDKYVYEVGKNISIKTDIFNFDNKKVINDYDVRIFKTYWEKVEDYSNGNKVFKYINKEIEVKKLKGKSSDRNYSSVDFTTNQAGYYKYYISTVDEKGNIIQESNYFYVAKEDETFSYNNAEGKIQILTDKKVYKPGEQIQLMLISPVENLNLLLTVEAENVYHYETVKMTKTIKMLSLVVDNNYSPNAFITISGFIGDQYYNSEEKITVLPENKFLDIQANFEKTEYQPQDEGNLIIKVNNFKGEPVNNVELSCGVVDESIFFVKQDPTVEIKKYFYSTRYNSVTTSTSMNFYFSGYSRKIRIDEYSELLDLDKKKLISKLKDSKSRLKFAEIKGSKISLENIRRDFRDVAFWTPNVYTDKNGIAKIKIKFPDNLTSWKAIIRGISYEAEIGSAVTKTICKKDLMVTMVTPRFFIENDKGIISSQIHNQTENDKSVRVDIEANGISLSERNKQVYIPKYSSIFIDWNFLVNKSENAIIRISAKDNLDMDKMETNVPILPAGLQVSEFGEFFLDSKNNSLDRTINIPVKQGVSNIKLKFSIAPSLSSIFMNSLNELIGYPYGCVEQTMSKFLPTVIVSRTIENLNVPFDKNLKNKIPDLVKAGIDKLSDMVNEEGAWGWWKDNPSDANMTALVVYGLINARNSGYQVPDYLISSGCNYLNKVVYDKKYSANQRSYALYSLSYSNYYNLKRESEKLKILIQDILAQNKDPEILAYLSIATHNFEFYNLSKDLAMQLDSASVNVSGLKFWKLPNNYSYSNSDEIEVAALALEAFYKNSFQIDKIHKILYYLISSRNGRAWNSTKQTARIIYSMQDYLKKYKELEPDYNIKFLLDDFGEKKIKITKDLVYGNPVEFTVDINDFKKNRLKIKSEFTGKGKAYINYSLEYFDNSTQIFSQSSGLKIEREFYNSSISFSKNGEESYSLTRSGSNLKSGDEVMVKIKLFVPENYSYLILEDPLFSGSEIMRKEIKLKNIRNKWDYNYLNYEIRDNKIAFFLSELEKGQYELSYFIKTYQKGNFTLNPSVISLMYYPRIKGVSKNEKIIVN